MWCTAEMEEEGLLLDALAVTAQPLVIVANAISPEQCRAAGLQSSQMTVVCKRPPYQLQLRVQQVIVIVLEHVDDSGCTFSIFLEHVYQARSRTPWHKDFASCERKLIYCTAGVCTDC